jgi:hypothetical protein
MMSQSSRLLKNFLHEFLKYSMPLQMSLEFDVCKLVDEMYSHAVGVVGVEKARPLFVVKNIVRLMLKVPHRIKVLQPSEACISFNQESEILNQNGEARVKIEYMGPLDGKGEGAVKVCKMALESIKNSDGQKIAEDIRQKMELNKTLREFRGKK